MSEASYTGVGSRSTPANVCEKLTQIAILLAREKITLRSGGAEGADAAFELGCDKANGSKEIYIPWLGFNNNKSTLVPRIFSDDSTYQKARLIAKKAHPSWHNMTEGGRELHTRNVYQLLGKTLDSPSRCLICWTENGKEKGGTRTAIVLAREYGAIIYNLGNEAMTSLSAEKIAKLVLGLYVKGEVSP